MWPEFRRLRKVWWFSFANVMINLHNDRHLSYQPNTCLRKTFCGIVSSNGRWLLILGILGLDFKFDVTSSLNYDTCVHNTSLPVPWTTDTAQLQRPVYWWRVEKINAVYCEDINACCWQNSELIGAFAKLRKATISFVLCVCLSVRPHGTSRLPMDGFSWKFTFEYFSKIPWENSSFIKVSQ